MGVFGPAIAKLLPHGAAHEGEPRLVEPRAKLVGTAHPDHDGCVVGHESEAFLTLDQGLLGSLACANVLGKNNDATDGAVGPLPRAHLPPLVLHAAVQPWKEVLVGPNYIAFQAAPMRFPP